MTSIQFFIDLFKLSYTSWVHGFEKRTMAWSTMGLWLKGCLQSNLRSLRLHVHTMASLKPVFSIFHLIKKDFYLLAFVAVAPDVIIIASGAPDLHDLWLTETHLNRLSASHPFCFARNASS